MSETPCQCDKAVGGQDDAAAARGATLWYVCAVVLLSRMPFLHAGYGNDPDAWLLADAARHIGTTGAYSASRVPGHPVQEFVCSLLWTGGPVVLNACTALLSVVAVGCFMRTIGRLGWRDGALAALALAMTPVVFINSTNSMDYVWALAFILAGHHCVWLGRPLLAGALLGLAIGCRVTSAGMLLPFGILVWTGCSGRRRWGDLLGMGGAAVLVAGACYAPAAIEYGGGLLSFAVPAQYPPWSAVLSRVTLRTWGFFGLLGLVAGAAWTLASRSRGRCEATAAAAPGVGPVLAWASAVAVYALLYLWLPLEEGYLIPAVPFAILLLGRVLSGSGFRLASIGLCLSSFVCSVGREAQASRQTYSSSAMRFEVAGQRWVIDPFRGPILRDHAERLGGMAFADRILSQGRALPKGSVVVVGHWLPQIRVRLGPESPELAKYVYLLSPDRLVRCQADGTVIYFLPEMAELNREVHGVDLCRAGATPLDLWWRAARRAR